MWSNLERGSSPVDWCESNYSISPVIAEFVNTVSNILFFLLPPLLIQLFQEYSKAVNPAINVLWVLFMVIGICSAYFHATLSLVGQLLDELAILWTCMTAFAVFLPKKYFPSFLHGNRRILGYYCAVSAVICSGFTVVYPVINAFILMGMYIPIIYVACEQLKSVQCGRVFRLGLRGIGTSFMALFCWIMDRMFCSAWLSIDFPYMHGLWHVLICISVSTFCVLFAYLHVTEEKPQQKPQLRYWPINEFELGVPYVTMKRSHHKLKDLAI